MKFIWTKFQLQGKDQRSNYQVRKILGIFCHLIILVLGQNNVKGLKVTKGLKKITIEGVWKGVKIQKKVSRENNSQIIWD